MTGQSDKILGQRLGSYEIVEAIGQGGMARVYKGYHEDLDRYAAVKVITWGLVEDEEFSLRFRREAQAIATLRHANIVTIYDFGKYEYGYYMVMEYIDGSDLEALLSEGKNLHPQEIQSIIHHIAQALDHAHSHNVVHRDVKPSNIMITQKGEAILTDFGLVMLPNSNGTTTIGTSFGTPYYMAPEQAVSAATAVPASDIYSLGVILFEMITGTPPYVADSPLGVALKHVSDPLPNVQDYAPEIPDGVNAVVQRAMAKEPSDRFSSAQEMADTLSQVWDEVEMQPLTPGPVMPPNLLPAPHTSASPPGLMTLPAPPTSTEMPSEQNTTDPVSKKSWTRPFMGILAALVLLLLSLGVILPLFNQEDTAAQAPTNEPPTANVVDPSPTISSAGLTSSVTTTANIIVESPSPTPSPSPMPSPSPTLSPSPSPSPTLSPTPLATETPSPTPTFTPTLAPIEPTATPTPDDPLLALRGQILFKTDRSGRVEIYQMNSDGTDQRPLAPEQAYLYNEAVRWEAFSQDQNETVVVRGEGQLDLWRVNIASGVELRITSEGAADYDPVWSPIDNRVIFVSERTGNGDLYLINLDGSGEFRLTLNEEDYDKHPSWSPDGQQVVYWSNRGWNRNRQIWLYNLNTGEDISLSNNPFRDWDPVWVK